MKITKNVSILISMFLVPKNPNIEECAFPSMMQINAIVFRLQSKTKPASINHMLRRDPLTHIRINTGKKDKLTEFLCFFQCQRVFEFGSQFQLNSKTIHNSSSKMKANQLNTDVS